MKTVGVRELKNRLSEFIRQAKSGEGVLATDASVPAGLLALARRNLLAIGAPADKGLYPALPRARRRKRTAAELLQDERGDR